MSLLRDAVLIADQSMVSLLISTADKLNLMLANPDRASEVDCEVEIAGLKSILDNTQSGGAKSVLISQKKAVAPAQPAPSDSYADTALKGFYFQANDLIDGLKHGHNFYIVNARLFTEVESQDQTIQHFFSELSSLGNLIATDVSLPENTTLETCANEEVTCRLFFTTPLEPFILSGALGIAEENIQQLDSSKLGAWVKSHAEVEKNIAHLSIKRHCVFLFSSNKNGKYFL
jgi:hypothetical protein